MCEYGTLKVVSRGPPPRPPPNFYRALIIWETHITSNRTGQIRSRDLEVTKWAQLRSFVLFGAELLFTEAKLKTNEELSEKHYDFYSPLSRNWN